jgi:hypothetical protein
MNANGSGFGRDGRDIPARGSACGERLKCKSIDAYLGCSKNVRLILARQRRPKATTDEHG